MKNSALARLFALGGVVLTAAVNLHCAHDRDHAPEPDLGVAAADLAIGVDAAVTGSRCAGEDGGGATQVRKYVINTVTVPMIYTDFGYDLDRDGRVDNNY